MAYRLKRGDDNKLLAMLTGAGISTSGYLPQNKNFMVPSSIQEEQGAQPSSVLEQFANLIKGAVVPHNLPEQAPRTDDSSVPVVMFSGGMGSTAVLWRCAYDPNCTPIVLHCTNFDSVECQKLKLEAILQVMSKSTNSDGGPLVSTRGTGSCGTPRSASTWLNLFNIPHKSPAERKVRLALLIVCGALFVDTDYQKCVFLVGPGINEFPSLEKDMYDFFGIRVVSPFSSKCYALMCFSEAIAISAKMQVQSQEPQKLAGASLPANLSDIMCSCKTPPPMAVRKNAPLGVFPIRITCGHCESCKSWYSAWLEACLEIPYIKIKGYDFRHWENASDLQVLQLKQHEISEYGLGNPKQQRAKKHKTKLLSSSNVDNSPVVNADENDEYEVDEDAEEDNSDIDEESTDEENQEDDAIDPDDFQNDDDDDMELNPDNLITDDLYEAFHHDSEASDDDETPKHKKRKTGKRSTKKKHDDDF